ncbi:copper amine oxidase N-terminal domain-containing protein, partial [bacterium]|nr:copper amine oxidase N-terminal domain-containing protein [bacterium]
EKKILVNDAPVSAVYDITKNQISFISPVNCVSGNKILIQIPAECGLINPNKQDFYILSVVFDDLDWDISSHPFFISTSLEWASVSIDTTQANEIASYQILLYSEKAISDQKEKMQIILPETIQLPAVIKPSAILINGKTVSSIIIQENSLFIQSDKALISNEIQEITILKEASLRNPDRNTGVIIGIICNESSSNIWSNTIPISERAKPSTKVLLSKPNAEAISSYLFDLSSLKNRLEIEDRIDILVPFQGYFTYTVDQAFIDGGFQIELKDIKNPEKGKYTIFLLVNGLAETIAIDIVPHLPFTVIHKLGGEYGNGDWYVKSPWVDFDNLYDDDYENKPITYVYFNDNEQDKYQPMVLPALLDSGQYVTKFSFFSSGEWGDEEPKSFIVYMDTIFPLFSVDSFPDSNKITVSEPDFFIKGNVKRNTISYFGNNQSFFDKYLSVNDLPVSVEESNGTFSYKVHLKKGDNTIQVKLADEAGNTTTKMYIITYLTTIEMMIDNQIAIVNGIQHTLPVAPYIQKGYTLAPFRFIGETVEADFDFSVNPTTKEVQAIFCSLDNTTIMLTINSTVAIVNGKKVGLDIPPKIINKTTVVPLRFIVEALNCDLKWDNENKSIKIIFPKQNQ